MAAVLLAACGGASSSVSDGSIMPQDKGGETGGFAPDGSAIVGDGSALIVTASLTLIVDSVDAALLDAREVVKAAGGVLTSSARGSDGGYPVYDDEGRPLGVVSGPASLSFRVPAAALEAVIDQLKELGTLSSERTDASDVSASLRDLGARLKNLRAAEANYIRLLDAATDISDLLAVTAQLDSVRGQIEQLSAEQAALTDQVDRSLLSLTLYPPATPIADAASGFDPGGVAEEAIALLVGIGRGAVSLLIYLLILGLPLGVIALASVPLIRRAWSRRPVAKGKGR
jgi:hypothetical protein